MEHLALILIGGPTVMAGTFLAARWLVYRQTNPAQGEAYLKAHRERQATERAQLVRAELARLDRQQPAPQPRRPKELTHR